MTMQSMEIAISWKETLREVVQIKPNKQGAGMFSIGEDPSCDFPVSSEFIGGETRAPLSRYENGTLIATIFAGTTGGLALSNGTISDLANAIESGLATPSTVCAGGYDLELPPGSLLEQSIGPWSFRVSPEKPMGKFVAPARFDWNANIFIAVSLGLHAIFLFMFFLVPPDNSSFMFDEDNSQTRFMKILLTPPALEQQIVPKTEKVADATDASKEGERHKDLPGLAGRRDSKKTNNRMGIKGPKYNKDPHLAREKIKEMAATSGVLAFLSNASMPTSPFGRDTASGMDPENALGALGGDNIGSNYGLEGLYTRGTGRGGGGDGTGGIGVGNLGFLGPGIGPGNSMRNPRRPKTDLGPRKPSGPSIRSMPPEIRGTLAKEVIRRIVRRHHNEIKYCYEKGLRSRPDLAGRVSIRFMISGNGVVKMSVVANSSVGDHTVESCIANTVARMTFPKPNDRGVVIVTYPFTLTSPTG